MISDGDDNYSDDNSEGGYSVTSNGDEEELLRIIMVMTMRIVNQR